MHFHLESTAERLTAKGAAASLLTSAPPVKPRPGAQHPAQVGCTNPDPAAGEMQITLWGG